MLAVFDKKWYVEEISFELSVHNKAKDGSRGII